MSAPRTIFLATCLLVVVWPGLGRAQTPPPAKEASSLEELLRQGAHQPPTDKIAPSMNGFNGAGYKEHEALLKRLYPAELIDPLADEFDRTVPGGFPTALARARTAGMPEALLAELEIKRAMFDVNFPVFTAALARLEAARPNWKDTASLFPSQREFDIFLGMVHATALQEQAAPGSFARTAMRLRKRAIARAVYQDLRQVDGCTDMYCIEHNVRAGQTVPAEGWLAEATPKSRLAINRGGDVTGQPFGPQRAGDLPAVPPATYRAVADAVPDEFWQPYRIPTAATTAAMPALTTPPAPPTVRSPTAVTSNRP